MVNPTPIPLQPVLHGRLRAARYWLVKGSSLKEAARLIAVDPSALDLTLWRQFGEPKA
jgi:hypothetical protein